MTKNKKSLDRAANKFILGQASNPIELLRAVYTLYTGTNRFSKWPLDLQETFTARSAEWNALTPDQQQNIVESILNPPVDSSVDPPV